ncbi:MAG: hypothetical protein ABR540_14135 [Acidimicrobiales bacterium]
MRADALGGRGGLAGALLMAHGVPAWMRGWRACSPPVPTGPAARPTGDRPPPEVVGVLASMALACAGG